MSVRKPTNIGKFYQNLFQLFKICLKYAPEDKLKNIQYYQYQAELGHNSNPRLVIETVMKLLRPYISCIMTRDDSIFVEHVFDGSENESGLLSSLRDVWTLLNDEVRDIVWKTIQLILMYGVLVIRDLEMLNQVNAHRSVPLTLEP
jgi:hypothetical protein